MLVVGKSAGVRIMGPAKEKMIRVCCDICSTEKRFLLEEKKEPKIRKPNSK